MVELPRLSYPVTRDYPWRSFTLVSIAGILVVLGVLVPLNSKFLPPTQSTISDAIFSVALTGYQVITASSSDYNATDPHWWNRFGARNKPGTLCAPQVFSAGDTFTTTYSIFPWTLVYPNVTDPTGIKFLYKGVDLDSCDVFNMGIQADLLASAVSVYAKVICTSPDIPIYIRTSWTGWGTSSSFDSREQELVFNQPSNDFTGRAGGIRAVNGM